PMVKGLIAQMVGRHVRVIDSAEQCAEDVARRLRTAGLMRGAAAAARLRAHRRAAAVLRDGSVRALRVARVAVPAAHGGPAHARAARRADPRGRAGANDAASRLTQEAIA